MREADINEKGDKALCPDLQLRLPHTRVNG